MALRLLVSDLKVLFLYRYGILGGVCTQLYHRFRHIRKHSDLEIHCGFRSNNGVDAMLGEFASLHFGLDENTTKHFVEEGNFDLVIIIDSEEYIIALRDWEGRPPTVIEVHTSIERNLEYLNRLVSGDLDIFITVSEYMKERIKHHRSEDVKELEILKFENVVDSDLFESSDTPGEGPPVLLWIGKIDDHKDWRKFLEICGEVSKKNEVVEFWIAGGQTSTSETAQEVFEEAEKREIIHRFRWFDRIENNKLPKLLSLVSKRGGLKIVTSHGESFGMSILESLLCGCPVISSRVGAIPEISPTNYCFRLYDLGDVSKASEMAIELLSNPFSKENREEMEEMRSVLVEKYSSSTRSDEYWKLLQEIAN